MSHNVTAWLADWYSGHCDGRWEHDHGIKIETIDNPGWSIIIDLKGTELEFIPFAEQTFNYDDESSWWICKRENKTFTAFCGANELGAALNVFRSWAEANSAPTQIKKPSAT